MPFAPSRRLIEKFLNNENDINAGASTSNAPPLEMNSFSNFPSSASAKRVESCLDKIVNFIAGPALHLLTSEMMKRMTENPQPESVPAHIREYVEFSLGCFGANCHSVFLTF